MNTPQYIINNKGEKVSVVLPVKEYEKIVEEYQKIREELEELQDIRLYDEAKKKDDGKRVLFTDYLKKRKKKHA